LAARRSAYGARRSGESDGRWIDTSVSRTTGQAEVPRTVLGRSIPLDPSLTIPDPDGPPPTPKALEQYEAVTLLVERATASVPTFAVTDQNGAAVAALCRGLDGIPLAL